tara:strand:- start:116 stop:985 length:870 start_codon:yes stop_codon:yes gene_type:complete
MYFDEDIILDVRLNTLNEIIDYFVIVESKFTHKGERRNLKFDLNNFPRFKDKIIYLVYENEPLEVKNIKKNDSENEKSTKSIFNAIYRENGQRNFITEGLKNADDDDFVLISDVDEIPNLQEINLSSFKEKLIFFNQEMFYYKFDLILPNFNWVGTRSCKKKYLKSPQWLRNIKARNYPFYRLDTFFSKTRYSSIKFINNGGWHFTNIKSPEKIRSKLKSYLHHREFDINPLSIEEIQDLIKNKKAIYDLTIDKRDQKIGDGKLLEKYNLDKLPSYINNNLKKFEKWID